MCGILVVWSGILGVVWCDVADDDELRCTGVI